MARKKSKRGGWSQSEISVEELRGISILFPDDVYHLAVWVAQSDQAMATPTTKPGTTLRGLAQNFVSLIPSIHRRHSVDDVMERFRKHGLEGNLVIRLPPDPE